MSSPFSRFYKLLQSFGIFRNGLSRNGLGFFAKGSAKDFSGRGAKSCAWLPACELRGGNGSLFHQFDLLIQVVRQATRHSPIFIVFSKKLYFLQK